MFSALKTTEQKKSEPRSEFYLDLLEVFGDPNNNPNQAQRNLNEEPLALGNPTIIRPNVIPRSSKSTLIKKPKPLPRSSVYSSASEKPRSSVKKKVPPPRPAPPKFKKPIAAQHLPKAPPSYSKVLEEDIRACINAYSTKERSSSLRSAPKTTVSNTCAKFKRSTSNPDSFDLIQLDTPNKADKEPSSMNINGVNVTTKNLKQAGSVASFLNKNPKLSKHVVPAKYQGAVKAAGKTYDFREAHKNDLKNLNVGQQQKHKQFDDLLGSVESEENTAKFKNSRTTTVKSSYHADGSVKLSKVESKITEPMPPKPIPLQATPIQSFDLNAGWGNDGFTENPEISQMHSISSPDKSVNEAENTPLSPSIPEPQQPPPVLHELSDDLPSFEPQGIALMNYTARNSNEISFQSKDIIMLLKEDNDRYFGRHGAEEGYFPKFCVDVLFPLPLNEEAKKRAASDEHPEGLSRFYTDINNIENRLSSLNVAETTEKNQTNDVKFKQSSGNDKMIVKALYNYDGDVESGDISFQAGDEITVISKVNDDWLYGQCHGIMGQLPVTFIDAIPSDVPVFQPSNQPTVLRITTACFDFEAQAGDELTFKIGDKICVTENIDDQWCKGYTEANPNHLGIFPTAFVKAVENLTDGGK